MRRRTGAFFRLHPLFGGALAAVAGVIAWRISPLAGGLTIAAVTFLAAWLLGGRAAIFAFGCAGLAGGSFGWQELIRVKAGETLVSRSLPHQAVSGRLLGDAKRSPNGWTGQVRLNAVGEFPSAIVWWIGNGEPPVDGAEVRARGRFERPEAPRNPGEFDQLAWFEQKGMAATFLADPNSVETHTGSLAAFGNWMRRGFREAVTTGLMPDSREAVVIRAVVIGEYPADEEEIVAAFRNSGTLHAFSVSGMHVAMVGGFAWFVLSWIGVPRRVAVPLLIGLMFGYSWISGNSPPALRSAWMGSVFLAAFVFRRQPNLLNALGAVLLVTLLWNGRLLFLPGVQLSYGVVAAIGLMSVAFEKWTARFSQPDSYMPTILLGRWQKRWLHLQRHGWNSTGVASAAWIGSTPLTLWHFGMTTPVAILAAIPMTLGIYALLVLSLVAAAFHPVLPQFSEGINRLNGWVANACTGTAGAFSKVPLGNVKIPRGNKPVLIIYDLEYGAGAAAFMGKDSTVLLDCGDRRSFHRTLLSSLRNLNAEPDSVVLSHADAGHVGGGAELLQTYSIRQAVMPVEKSRSKVYSEWFDLALASQTKLIAATPGTSFPFPDGATLEVLLTPDPATPNAIADDRVAIYRLHWQRRKILFMSDAGIKTERRLLDSGIDLKSDVLIAGHHRSDLSLSDEFIEAVRPKAIVASNPPYPPTEQLDPAKPALWRARGIQVFDQRQTGGVSIRIEEDDILKIEGFANHSIERLSR